MGDKKNGPDGPQAEVVVQDEEIWSPIFEDGALHFGVSGVDDSGTEGLGLAFEMEGRIAGWAEIVDGGCALRGWPQMRRVAGRAEEIRCAPGFGTDAGPLGGAFVAIEASSRQMQVHAGIRSWLRSVGRRTS